jgi:hypothetical protein
MSRNLIVASTIARSRTRFEFLQRLRERIFILKHYTQFNIPLATSLAIFILYIERLLSVNLAPKVNTRGFYTMIIAGCMGHITWCNIPCNAMLKSSFLTLLDKLFSVTAKWMLSSAGIDPQFPTYDTVLNPIEHIRHCVESSTLSWLLVFHLYFLSLTRHIWSCKTTSLKHEPRWHITQPVVFTTRSLARCLFESQNDFCRTGTVVDKSSFPLDHLLVVARLLKLIHHNLFLLTVLPA